MGPASPSLRVCRRPGVPRNLHPPSLSLGGGAHGTTQAESSGRNGVPRPRQAVGAPTSPGAPDSGSTPAPPPRPHRDGILGAGIDDGLEQVVKLVHVQLRLLQELLHLLLQRVGHGCCHLLLEGRVTPRRHEEAPGADTPRLAPAWPAPSIHTGSLRHALESRHSTRAGRG